MTGALPPSRGCSDLELEQPCLCLLLRPSQAGISNLYFNFESCCHHFQIKRLSCLSTNVAAALDIPTRPRGTGGERGGFRNAVP